MNKYCSKNYFDILPDYIIEKNIIPYLSSIDLILSLRAVNTTFFQCTKNTITIVFPEEIYKNLQNLVNIYKQQELVETFNKITNQLFNDRNILFIYMLQLNFSLVIQKILEQNTDDRVLDLIALFYVVIKNQNKYELLVNRQLNELKDITGGEEASEEMKNLLENALNIDDIHNNFNEYITVFQTLDEEYLKSMDLTGALYNYLGKLIEFQITKFKHRKFREDMDNFLKEITKTSENWPKKKLFYEKVIGFLDESRTSNEKIKFIIDLFKKYNIDNPITDWEFNKIISINLNGEEGYIDIQTNRKSINKAFERLEKMYNFYKKNKNIKNNKIVFSVKNKDYNIGEFLFILSMILPKYEIDDESFAITNNFIKQNTFKLLENNN
jgi:hypothetical protein